MEGKKEVKMNKLLRLEVGERITLRMLEMKELIWMDVKKSKRRANVTVGIW